MTGAAHLAGDLARRRLRPLAFLAVGAQPCRYSKNYKVHQLPNDCGRDCRQQHGRRRCYHRLPPSHVLSIHPCAAVTRRDCGNKSDSKR
jgi:hypothetical protein